MAESESQNDIEITEEEVLENEDPTDPNESETEDEQVVKSVKIMKTTHRFGEEKSSMN